MRIRVTTRSDLLEERKRQHIERGYRIEDERPVAVNGMCSFIASTSACRGGKTLNLRSRKQNRWTHRSSGLVPNKFRRSGTRESGQISNGLRNNCLYGERQFES